MNWKFFYASIKTTHYFYLYLLSLALAFACFFLYTFLQFYDFAIVGWALLFLILLAFAVFIKSSILLFKSKSHIRILQFLVFIFVFLYALTAIMRENERFRDWRVINYNVAKIAQKAFGLIQTYLITTEQYPDANSWSDQIAAYQWHGSFGIGQLPKIESCLVFNKNLGNRRKQLVEPNTVVFFEAQGNWNQSGDSSHFQKLKLEKRFMFNSSRFGFIVFADGKIARYRFRDGAISFWKTPPYFNNWFKNQPPFLPSGQTEYSPLNWGNK